MSSISSLPATPVAAKEPVPVPKSLDELVELLHKELGANGLTCEGVDVDRVQALMTNYQSNEEDWKKYAYFDKGRYTRNLVDDGNGKFNLMILAWPENVGSAIHDHSGSHCIMKMLDGELKETLYEWPDKVVSEADHPDSGLGSDNSDDEGKKPCAMTVKRETVLHRNETTYMSDQLGLHRVANPLKTAGSLSLHLYTPPYETCKTFNERSSQARSSGKCVFFSAQGEKLESCPSAAYLACALTEDIK
ncbi:Cysteine dioxygenase [Podila verticillata]|nr:Cysteine dioxygenase [Podila verticillata]KFH64642.1 hypothetical protein MVEG_09374 [Podila verticillata NRRL 6337]